MGYHNMFFFLTKKIVVCTIMKLFWSPKRTPASDVPYSCTPYSTCIVIVMTSLLFSFPKALYHPCMKGIRKNFACGIQYWALECGTLLRAIRNPSKEWNPESKFHWLEVESSTLKCGIQNPRLSWISLHGATKNS